MEMYEDKEFLTVQEVAEALGITKQAVYQKLNKNWSTFVQEIDGQKMLKKEVLQVEKPRDKAIESKVDQKVEQVYQELINYLKEENQRLINANKEKDAVIQSYAERFATLVEREQEISAKALNTTGQAQLLHAMSESQDMESPSMDDDPPSMAEENPNITEESNTTSGNRTWRERFAAWILGK